MTKKSFFLVVGGGFGQIPAIKAAKSLGYHVLVVDKNPNAVGMKLADVALPIDLLQIEAVVNAAKKYSVIGALTMQSDIGVPTVGAVVDALGLTGCGLDVAMRCSNKILTRECFASSDVPQPRFEVVDSVEAALLASVKIGFPCVIKAPDSSGSRGVIRVSDIDEVNNAFEEAIINTRGKKVLVEEFINGLEVGAQSFSVNGKCHTVLVHDDEMSKPPHMIPIAHAFPSSLSQTQVDKVKIAISKCVEALGILDGPANIDLIIDNHGDPKIIEVGARIGATCLPELVECYTGIDWTKISVQLASGQCPDLNVKKVQPCAAFILESNGDGIMQGYELPDIYRTNPKIVEWELTVMPGERVSVLRKGTDRIGKVLAVGNSTKDALDLARDFRDSLKVFVSN